MPEVDEGTHVSSVVPREIVKRLDIKITEIQLKLLREGKRKGDIVPSRSSWIRAAIIHFLNCPHVNGPNGHNKT